jgi:signal transduction histidine kinase
VSDIVQDLEVKISSAATSKEKVDLLNQLAVELSQRSQENLPKAAALLQWAQALLHEVNDPSTSAVIFNTLGNTYALMGETQAALDHLQRAQTIFRKQKKPAQQASVLNDLSQVYLTLGNQEQALRSLEDSLALVRQASLLDEQAQTLSQVASLHFAQGNTPLAIERYQESCQIYRDAGDAAGEARVQIRLGDSYLAMGEANRAADCFRNSFSLAQKAGIQETAVEALLKLGEFYRLAGQSAEALPYLRNARDLAEETGQRVALYECHRALAQVYRQLRDFERALVHFEQFFQLREEVSRQQLQEHQKNLESLFQAEKSGMETEIFQLKNVILQEEIRQRQEVEAALTSTNAQLREEVASREQLIDDLNAFSFMVAHDLKNPLTNIALTAGVLRMSVTLANDKVGQDAAERLAHQVEKINRIINELLVLASVQKEDIHTEPLDMEAVICEVELRLDRLIKEHRPEIRKPLVWPSACGHASWVEEIWENYVSNAIHYGGRPPIVEIGADEPKDGMVRFWVRDNGLGLDERARAQLFALFNRSSSSRTTGHGLGLSIVKRIADKLGGEVGVENECPGEGCTFYFTLPANEEEEE